MSRTPNARASSRSSAIAAAVARCARSTAFATLAAAGLTAPALAPAGLSAQTPAPAGYTPEECPSCEAWNAPREPVRIFGGTWWVGTEGLGAVLITSDSGHVLIDGGLPESAPHIVRNIERLGFRLADVKLILNSHAHYDHAGGIAALQEASGAAVAASPASAADLESGTPGLADPQHSIALPYPPARDVRVIEDGETLRVGPIAVTAHFTPGHTPGGTTWAWRSCDGDRCVDLVYADSQTPVSAEDFLYASSESYPHALEDFARGHAVLERLSCDVLLAPHPGASRLWQRVAAREAGDPDALIDPEACRRYAAAAREQLARRVERERAAASEPEERGARPGEERREPPENRREPPENRRESGSR